jgi:hypothetical protein
LREKDKKEKEEKQKAAESKYANSILIPGISSGFTSLEAARESVFGDC